ncbi:MAG: hypothetical protein S4CHLAM37_11370 [Chlamydiia bacterium]|nr:hypothetical protein [Chlamydiia bacterium]
MNIIQVGRNIATSSYRSVEAGYNAVSNGINARTNNVALRALSWAAVIGSAGAVAGAGVYAGLLYTGTIVAGSFGECAEFIAMCSLLSICTFNLCYGAVRLVRDISEDWALFWGAESSIAGASALTDLIDSLD